MRLNWSCLWSLDFLDELPKSCSSETHRPSPALSAKHCPDYVCKIYLPLHHLCGSFNKYSSNFCLQLWFTHFFLQRKLLLASVHRQHLWMHGNTFISGKQADLPAPALPQTPDVKTLPFHLLLCSQQLLDLSHQPCEVAHVGVKVGQDAPGEEQGQGCSRPGAVWGREGLAEPQKLQQGVFSMAAKDKNAKNKHFLTRTDFHLDFHFLSAFFNGCNFKA